MSQGKKILLYSASLFVGLFFLFTGVVEAKGFLAPLVTAIILALLALPLSKFLEKAIARGFASFLTTFVLLLFSLGFIWLISLQIRSFIDDWPEIKEAMTPKLEDFKSYIFEHTPLTEDDLNKSMEGDAVPFLGSAGETGTMALGFFNKTLSFLGTYFLIFIYIFFLLNYRTKFKNFIVMFFQEKKKKEVKEVVDKSGTVVQQYLVGRLLLMLFLATLYSIGLGISGVDNFIIVSIIAALLTLIPVLGNIVGFTLAMAFSYLSTGETAALIGIIITFSCAQLLENYVLQPFIIGDKVNMHPFLVILVVILGGLLWGAIGMILAIPIMAILTIIFLHVPALYPFGYLFSNKGKPKKSENKA